MELRFPCRETLGAAPPVWLLTLAGALAASPAALALGQRVDPSRTQAADTAPRRVQAQTSHEPRLLLTVSQEGPGAPAVFALAIQADTSRVLLGPPLVTVPYGKVTVDLEALGDAGGRFTWDVRSARRAAPALRGLEMSVVWHAVPRDARYDEMAVENFVTTAYVTLSVAGRVSVGDLRTASVPPKLRAQDDYAPRCAYRYNHATPDMVISARRYHSGADTGISIYLREGYVFADRPTVQTTVGRLGERRRWEPRGTHAYDYVAWRPPDEGPEKPVEGAVTWTWTAVSPRKGDRKSGTLAVHVTVWPGGRLECRYTEATSRAEAAPAAPRQ